MNARAIRVEVVYAHPAAAFVRPLTLARGARVEDALRLSGVFEAHPQLDAMDCPVGIWGRRIDREALLSDGDRVEIYRPLRMDPKQARRERARRGAKLR